MGLVIRSLPFDNYVLQLMPDGGEKILTPLGLGSDPVMPIPLWSERTYNPRFLSKTGDKIGFAVTVICLAYLLGWLIWIVSCWQHPVIRVSDPLFSALSVVGLCVLACDNFFSASFQNDVSCAASKWLFTLGLTLGFAPLVLKNLRIWSLWHNRSNTLSPAPIRQWHLLVALFGLLMVDVLINLWWYLRTGMRAVKVSVDPYRPSLDYSWCASFADGKAFFLALTVFKIVCILAALYLSYLLRNVSATYSESRYIALCCYNLAVTLSVVLPVISSEASLGHDRTLLIRNLLIVFLCVTTVTIMWGPKWIAVRAAQAKKRAEMAAAHRAGITLSSSSERVTTPRIPLPPPPQQVSLKFPPLDDHAAPGVLDDGAHELQGVRNAHVADIELQSVADAQFQSDVGLSAVARSVDNDTSHIHTQAPSSLYPPHSAVVRLHGVGGCMDQPRGNYAPAPPDASTAHAPLLSPITQSPASPRLPHDPTAVLHAACELLESSSEHDLSSYDLSRMQSALGQCLTRRSAPRALHSAGVVAPPLRVQPPVYQDLLYVSSSLSGTSGSSSSLGSSAASSGCYPPDTLLVHSTSQPDMPGPPTGCGGGNHLSSSSSSWTSQPQSAAYSSGDATPALAQSRLPQSASVIPAESAAAEAAASAAAAAALRDRTPSSQKRALPPVQASHADGGDATLHMD